MKREWIKTASELIANLSSRRLTATEVENVITACLLEALAKKVAEDFDVEEE